MPPMTAWSSSMTAGHDPLDTSALTVALAALAGVTAQVIGRRVGLPGIVLLLGAGVALGPDALNVIRPQTLGDALQVLVGFAVAVILFEGGLALDINRLRRAQRPVQRLVTIGAIATLLLGTLVAKAATGWEWKICFLFGTLIIVTGPTVVTPLLRRLRVEPRVATVLEAEGVLIDAVGAVTAAVALEVALQPTAENVASAFVNLAGTLGFGIVAGLVGGGFLALVFRLKSVIPEGLENIFALAFVLALFQTTNAVFHESGIAAVTVAGIVLARTALPVHQEMHHFKEQLTAMLIGMLFILLAADVRLADVRALGWPGLLTVAGVVLVVRPINVAVGTFGSSLSAQQRMFIAWIGPRGIIAAAVASLFAVRLEQEGLPQGRALQALVFAVIAVSVLWAGLTGGLAAQWLGLRRPKDTGWAILGVNELSLTVARTLRDGGEGVIMIEADPHAAQAAEKEGFRTLFANPFELRTLMRAELSSRTGVLALTPNEETNFLFAQRARRRGKAKRIMIALESANAGVTDAMIERIEAELWTGTPVDVAKWSLRLRQRATGLERWMVTDATARLTVKALFELTEQGLIAPVALRRGAQVIPVSQRLELEANDQVLLLLASDKRAEARAGLKTRGFERIA